jgi:hypothetical protein
MTISRIWVRWRACGVHDAAGGRTSTGIGQTLQSLSTPGTVETRIGTLHFKDGMPSKQTIDKVYDNLDFTHAFEAFVNTFKGSASAPSTRAF